MDIYHLDYILHDPEESHGWMYRAEIPDLQGCRAWGDNPAETLEELREVAKNMIQLRRENGEPLPPGIPPQSRHKGSLSLGIPEYWRFDETGEFHESLLAGDRLADGRYEPVPIETVGEGVVQGYSSVLNLLIRWDHGQLGWHDPETGQHIIRYEDLEARAEEAEARVRELEAELERRQQG